MPVTWSFWQWNRDCYIVNPINYHPYPTTKKNSMLVYTLCWPIPAHTTSPRKLGFPTTTVTVLATPPYPHHSPVPIQRRHVSQLLSNDGFAPRRTIGSGSPSGWPSFGTHPLPFFMPFQKIYSIDASPLSCLQSSFASCPVKEIPTPCQN